MAHVREKPPLRLHWQATTPAGRCYRWGEDEPEPENVPGSVSFSTTMPGGFENASVTLPRKSAREYGDLERLTTLTCYGPGGEVAWEGRLERAPRVSGDQIAVSPAAVGWQAHLEDDKSVREIYRDIDLTRWGVPTNQYVLNRQTSSHGQADAAADSTNGPEIRQTVSGLENSFPLVTSMYASPVDIGSVYYAVRSGGFGWSPGDAQYTANLGLDNDDTAAAFTEQTGDVAASVPTSGTLSAAGAGRRWAFAYWNYGVAGDWTATYGLLWKFAVYGNHGLTKRGTEPNVGFYASDIVEHAVNRFASLLATDIQQSQYIIQHAVFPEMTTAGEIVRQATRFSLQDWAVWEGQTGPTFYWHNRGQRGRSWRMRIAPAQLEEAGQSVERLYESVIVEYQDVDGSTITVGPPNSGADTEDDALVDTDPENPAVKAGITKRALLTMGVAVSDDAVAVGTRFLEEQKQLDASGSAQIVGHVEDDHGVLHPAWRVRAGDTITFVDAADQGARRIVRTNYDHGSRTCSVDIDAPPEGLQALLERLGADLVMIGL